MSCIDTHGREINPRDIIRHIFGPFPDNFMAARQQDPTNRCWLSDGFAGKRTVKELMTGAVVVNRIDTKIPVYASCYVEVLHEEGKS